MHEGKGLKVAFEAHTATRGMIGLQAVKAAARLAVRSRQPSGCTPNTIVRTITLRDAFEEVHWYVKPLTADYWVSGLTRVKNAVLDQGRRSLVTMRRIVPLGSPRENGSADESAGTPTPRTLTPGSTR